MFIKDFTKYLLERITYILYIKFMKYKQMEDWEQIDRRCPNDIIL